MRDALRDELEIKIFWALTEDSSGKMVISHREVIEIMNEALSYIQNNPSITDIELAANEIESSLNNDTESSLFEGGADYSKKRDTLDKYRAALLIMEKHT